MGIFEGVWNKTGAYLPRRLRDKLSKAILQNYHHLLNQILFPLLDITKTTMVAQYYLDEHKALHTALARGSYC